ncbi:MAG: hypothetical protein IKA43_00405 [Clostridia bacterium]|nr:hypothetical protein [Clostridia bacterium]
MQQFGSFMKFCATCNFWMGQRETDYNGTYSRVQDVNARAKCMCQSGPWRNQLRGPMAFCNSYEKWSVLRKG